MSMFNIRVFELTPHQVERTRTAYVQDTRDGQVYFVAGVDSVIEAAHRWMLANYSFDYDIMQTTDSDDMPQGGGCTACQRANARFQVYLDCGDD